MFHTRSNQILLIVFGGATLLNLIL